MVSQDSYMSSIHYDSDCARGVEEYRSYFNRGFIGWGLETLTLPTFS